MNGAYYLRAHGHSALETGEHGVCNDNFGVEGKK
jgi:hypothetical protein